MSNLSLPYETRIAKAIEACQASQNPNLSQIAREWAVPRTTLRGRVKNERRARTSQIPKNYALEGWQEEALVRWMIEIAGWNMLVTPDIIRD